VSPCLRHPVTRRKSPGGKEQAFNRILGRRLAHFRNITAGKSRETETARLRGTERGRMRLKQRLLRVVGNRLFAKGEILAVSDPAPRFRRVEIRSPSSWVREWVPGAKTQINVGAWNVRTYTPVSLDPTWGTLKILAYRHASAPETEASQAIEAPGSR